MTTKDNFQYSTKFGVAANTHFNIKAKVRLMNIAQKDADPLKGKVSFELAIFQDDIWDDLQDSSDTCAFKRNHATKLINVEPDLLGEKLEVKLKVYSKERPHLFYMVVMDCRNDFPAFQILNPKNAPKVHVLWQMSTSDNDQFSYEDTGSLGLSVKILIAQAIFAVIAIRSYLQQLRQLDRYFTPHVILFCSLQALLVSQLFQTLHLWYYADDGEGLVVLEILSKIAQATSEVSMSMLLIVLANGWTILYQDIDIDDRLEIFIPAAALTVMVHVMVAALTFIDVDANHKYHDFAGVQGWVLFIAKLVLWGFFVYCYSETFPKVEKRSQPYLKKLFILSSAYLLAVPMSILMTFMFAPYERQFVFDALSHSLIFATNVFMLYEISYKGSSWFAANLDAMGLLPTSMVNNSK